ncbi:MAG: hypothetical protein ACXVP0_04750 [Bacteroidia bacterium]
MSHDHHHDSHSNEPKPVSFTAPLILGIVTVFVLLAFVSIGNPCHERDCAENCSKECKEACEKGEHGEHGTEAKQGEGHEGHEAAAAEGHGAEAAAVTADSSKTEPAKAEEVKEEAHH